MMTARCAIGEGLRALRRCDGSTSVTGYLGIRFARVRCVRIQPRAMVDYVDTCMNARSHSTERVKVISWLLGVHLPPKVFVWAPIRQPCLSFFAHAKEAEC